MQRLTKFSIFLLLSFSFGTLYANAMDDSPHYAPPTATCKMDGDYFNCTFDSPYFNLTDPGVFEEGVYHFTGAYRESYTGLDYEYKNDKGAHIVLQMGYSMIDIDKNAPGNQWQSDKYGDRCEPAQREDVVACPFTHTPYAKTN